MIDTGADVSVIPAYNKSDLYKTKLTFSAANGININTFGQKFLLLDLSLRRDFPWVFTLADVNKPIIGNDFLKAYDLLIDIRQRCLIDKKTGLKAIASISNISKNVQGPSLRSFQSYDNIFSEFPELLKLPSATTAIKVSHNVSHTIITNG